MLRFFIFLLEVCLAKTWARLNAFEINNIQGQETKSH